SGCAALAFGREGEESAGRFAERGRISPETPRIRGGEKKHFTANPPSRRHRLGDAPARRALPRGIRLGRALRGAGGGDRGEVRAGLRPGARALLDRGDGRRAGRLCISGEKY